MINPSELRIGNSIWDILNREVVGVGSTQKDLLGTSINGSCPSQFKPIPLTEEIIKKLRRVIKEDFKPLEFDEREPGERQVEKQYWSSWIDDDNKLHLCPSYKRNFKEDPAYKINPPEFWFCWYCSGSRFLSVQSLYKLKYLHQLQNLFYSITYQELELPL